VRSLFAVAGEGGRIATSGRPLSDTVATSLAEGLAQVRAGQLRAGRPLLRIDAGSEPHVLVWRVPDPRIPGSPPIIGFVADLSFIRGPVDRILAQAPLLPPSLGNDTRRLVSVRVLTPDGREIYASRSEWSPYASEKMLDAELGSLRLSVALDPSAAGTLIIGGLPRSRLPLLAGLTVLTAGLVFIAIVQLRREHELGRLRADFISGVSHELRTPLAQIRMFGETLLLGRVRSPAEHERSLAVIVQESRRLTHLIENVLQFSRADRGASSVSIASVRVDTLLRDILDGFAPLASSRRMSIVRRIEYGLTVPVDAEAFRQIILNLLDNAVKYGPQGQTVMVRAQCEGDVARIAIDDEGPGVPPEHAARIWQPFYRATRDAAVSGTGIGLAIVKHSSTFIEDTCP
jgi:signal transduction histidine kinase